MHFGGIYDNSVQTLQDFRTTNLKLVTEIERKWFAKSVSSLIPLKVMIGSVNFLTDLRLLRLWISVLEFLLIYCYCIK